MVWLCSLGCMLNPCSFRHGVPGTQTHSEERSNKMDFRNFWPNLTILQIRKLRLREVMFKVNRLDWIVTDLGLKWALLSLSWQLIFIAVLLLYFYLIFGVISCTCRWAILHLRLSVHWILHMQWLFFWSHFHHPLPWIFSSPNSHSSEMSQSLSTTIVFILFISFPFLWSLML